MLKGKHLMNKKYRIVMKDGTTHRGNEVEHKPGFIQVLSWDGETRYPAGEVEKIYLSKTESFLDYFIPLMVVIIALLIFLIL